MAWEAGVSGLNIVDDYTKQCLAIKVDTFLIGRRVAAVMERLLETRGLQELVTVDDGPKFTGEVFDKWAYRHRLTLRFIGPGKPHQDAYIESLNEKFRDGYLNEHWFVSLRHAKRLIEEWRWDYNEERPPSSLGYWTNWKVVSELLTVGSMTILD